MVSKWIIPVIFVLKDTRKVCEFQNFFSDWNLSKQKGNIFKEHIQSTFEMNLTLK